MAADKQRNEYLVKHFILAHNHLSHLGKDAIAHCLEPFNALLQLGYIRRQFRSNLHR
jgi:hypothetical protein